MSKFIRLAVNFSYHFAISARFLCQITSTETTLDQRDKNSVQADQTANYSNHLMTLYNLSFYTNRTFFFQNGANCNPLLWDTFLLFSSFLFLPASKTEFFSHAYPVKIELCDLQGVMDIIFINPRAFFLTRLAI